MRTTKSPMFILENSRQALSKVKSDTDFPAYRQSIRLPGPLAVVLFTNVNWLTARASFSDRVAGLRRGADAYLTKPFQREELDVVLSNLLKPVIYCRSITVSWRCKTAPSNPVSSEQGDLLENQFLHKLRSVVDAQLVNDRGPLSIDEICQLMGIGRTMLHTKMVALTGMSAIVRLLLLLVG